VQTDELQQLLAIHGLTSKVKGQEVAIAECLFCGNPKHNLELNASRGVYHAWCCGARGTIRNFLREHLRVDKYVPVNITIAQTRTSGVGVVTVPNFIKAIESNWAWDYLFGRGLSIVDVAIYNIGQGFGGNDGEWEGRIVFTLMDYFEHSSVGWVGRAALPGVEPKYYAHWPTGTKRITGYHARSDVHVLCEGVFDGLAAHRAGFNAAVLGGVEERAVEEWAARVPSAHYVAVMLDGDAAAQAERLFWRILPVHEKTFLVRLPVEFDPAQLDPTVVQTLIRRSV
jgi:hypothetical protein